MTWSKRVTKSLVICIKCEVDIGKKPLSTCTSKEHSLYFENKKKRNNEYRRKRRKIDPYYATGFNKESWKVYSRNQYRDRKREIIERLGGKCAECGFSDFRALTIDHIHGKGNAERVAYGWKYLKVLYQLSPKELKAKYQCLCSNCNTIKEFDRKWVK